MLVTEQDRLRQDIDALVERLGRARSALMPILQEVQRKYSLVSPFAMQVIADRLGIHPVEVHGVVSFYSFLSEKPKGRYVIRLCRTISCDMAGKTRIARQLKRQSGSHRTLCRGGWPDVVFAFHDDDELGPKMLARIAKSTGLRPEDL